MNRNSLLIELAFLVLGLVMSAITGNYLYFMPPSLLVGALFATAIGKRDKEENE